MGGVGDDFACGEGSWKVGGMRSGTEVLKGTEWEVPRRRERNPTGQLDR